MDEAKLAKLLAENVEQTMSAMLGGGTFTVEQERPALTVDALNQMMRDAQADIEAARRQRFGIASLWGGTRVHEDEGLADPVEDWTEVRSPPRARRRRRLGHPQRIRIRMVPRRQVYVFRETGMVVMHPEIARQLRKETDLG